MTQPQAASLELGLWAVMGFVGIAVGVGRCVGKQRVAAQHVDDLFSVGLPVGSAVDVATCMQALCQCLNKRGLNQAALVVTGFVPRIGEENMHAVQTGRGQHVGDNFYGIVRADTDVVQALLANALEQSTYAGLVHFAAQKVDFWHGGGNLRGGVSHAEANFKYQWGLAAKDGGVVGRCGLVG